MPSQKSKAKSFRALHVSGAPLVLFNAWDAGSARAVTAAGAKAIATGSWSVAKANGFDDGEDLPLDLAIANLARITKATSLPVTIDLESGYGATPQAVAKTIRRSIEAGAIGCNIEDSDPATGKLRKASDQARRIAQARKAASASGVAYFINGRTDVFFQKPPKEHDDAMVAEALERARIYAAVGADGLFVPGLIDPKLIAKVVKGSPLPVNIMVSNGTPDSRVLAKAGVARISHGPRPYLLAMKALEDAARAATL
ncbi:MAG: isocitrate lyase/phosphoenolpyruvate mutase family protein [Alphaproteobacteria bacterium]|nr:isocitrate lyase/phosphoenolpyruvate mutase family protein [Alphaproteobacteria bacterium]